MPAKKEEAERKINEYIQQLNDLYNSAKDLGVSKKDLDEVISKGMRIGNYPPNSEVREAIKYKNKTIKLDSETKKMY